MHIKHCARFSYSFGATAILKPALFTQFPCAQESLCDLDAHRLHCKHAHEHRSKANAHVARTQRTIEEHECIPNF